MINKGEVIIRLCQLFPDVNFITCIGDDKTDEDMFKALKKIGKSSCESTFSCIVQSNPESTQAKYFTHTPKDVLNFLHLLTEQPSIKSN